MAQQNFRCAGCGMAVAPGKHICLFFFVHFVFYVVTLTTLAAHKPLECISCHSLYLTRRLVKKCL